VLILVQYGNEEQGLRANVMLFRLVFFIEFMFLMLNYFLGYYQNSNLHVIYVWGWNFDSGRLCSSQQILGLTYVIVNQIVNYVVNVVVDIIDQLNC
jgi:hypothetical protein